MRAIGAWLALALFATAGGASVGAEFVEGVERPSLVIEGGPSSVEVTGVGGRRVDAHLELPDDYEAPRPLLEVETSTDRVVVRLEGVHDPGVRLVVTVPDRIDLTVRADNGGPVLISGVQGEIEVANSNSGVELRDVGGSATVATSNGPIFATFSWVEPERPMSFMTSNGTIDVEFPASLRADVYLETDNGELESDFELLDDGRPTEEVHRRVGGRLKRVRAGAIGGGGSPFRFRTDNSSIALRRSTQ